MMKPVEKMQTPQKGTMKTILSRLLAFAFIFCSPLFMTGTLVSLRADASTGTKLAKPSSAPVRSDIKKPSPEETIYEKFGLSDFGLDYEIFELAMKGFDKLTRDGILNKDSILTIVDFTRSSREKRLFVIDLKQKGLVYQSLVAHGKNSGGEFARSFSNSPQSNKSSLGFYVTRDTYNGSNGYSLKLDGCEKGVNDKAMDRAIVMHAADYANEEVARNQGFIGRSFGCPALPQKMNKKIIDKIKQGNCLFVYFPDSKYLNSSRILNG
jgi:hypothetical protein